MRMGDKLLPHRLLINTALRNAGNDLKEHIAAQRTVFEQKKMQCQADIDAAREESESNLRLLQNAYEESLAKECNDLRDLQTLFFSYGECYFYRQYLYVCKENAETECQILKNYIVFLSEQMRLIGDEITILENRKTILSRQVQIQDIIELLKQTGGGINTEGIGNARDLLASVNIAIGACDDANFVEKRALIRLQSILQERAEYLSVIRYIDWLIQQKINLSKELKQERDYIASCKEQKENMLSAVLEKIGAQNKLLSDFSLQLRNIWAVPMADLYTELARCVSDLDYAYVQKKTVTEEIQHMIDVKSHDTDKWDRLQQQRKSYVEEISNLKSQKRALHSKLKQWRERKNKVFDLFTHFHVFLIQPNGTKEYAEVLVLRKRIDSIQSEIAEKDRVFHEKAERVQQEHSQLLPILEENVLRADQLVTSCQKNVTDAEQRLALKKTQDRRFFLVRLFSESDDVILAQGILTKEKQNLLRARQRLQEEKKKRQDAIAAYNQQLEIIRKEHCREISRLESKSNAAKRAIEFILSRPKGAKDHGD